MLSQIIRTATRPLVGKGLGRLTILRRAYSKITQQVLTEQDKRVDLGQFKIDVSTEQRGLDGMSAVLISTKQYEPMTTAIVERLVKDGDVVIDIGANIGYFSLLSATCCAGQVIAIEPEPFNCKCLRHNIEINNYDDKILVIQAAVSNISGTGTLYVSKDESGEHSLVNGRKHIKKSIEVRCIRLDDLEDVIQQQRIKLVKIDVEGNEVNVLLGGKKILGKTDNVITEFWPPGIEASGYTTQAYYGLLTDMFKYVYTVDEIRKQVVPSSYEDIIKRCQQGRFSVNLLCSKTKEIM